MPTGTAKAVFPGGSAVGTFKNSLNILSERGFFPAKERLKSTKDRYLYHCPLSGHEDRDPTFSVHADGIRWKCWACGGGGPRDLRRLLDGDLVPVLPIKPLPKSNKAPQADDKPTGCTLAQLAPAKCLDTEHLRRLGWKDTSWFGIPAVVIPYPDGPRYRVGLEGKHRFRWGKGSKTGLLGLDRMPKPRATVLLVEGETDFAQATCADIATIAVPGATIFQEEWAEVLQGYKLVVWQEPDKAGQGLVDKWAEWFPDIRVIEAPPGIKDVCELADQCGSGFQEALRDLIDEARIIPPADQMDWAEIVRAHQGTPQPENYYKPGEPRNDPSDSKKQNETSQWCHHPYQAYVDECWPIHSRRRKAAQGTDTPDRLTGEIKAHWRFLRTNSKPSDAEKDYIEPYGVKLCIAVENPHLATSDLEPLVVALLGEKDYQDEEHPIVKRIRDCWASCRWDCAQHGTKMTGQAECRLHYCPNCLTDISRDLDRARLPDIDPESGGAYHSIWLIGRYPLPENLFDWGNSLGALQQTWGETLTKIQRRKASKRTVLWRSFTVYYDLNEAWIHWKVMFKEESPGQADSAIAELNQAMGTEIYDQRRFVHGELATLQLVENSRTHLLGFSELIDWPKKFELFAAHHDATKGRHVFQGMGALWTLLRNLPDPEPLTCDECGSPLKRVIERSQQPRQDSEGQTTGGPDPPGYVPRGWWS